MSALSQVCGTFELLESILLHLSPRDILCCEAVCHRLQFVIKTSLPLKQKLHLEPDQTSSLSIISVEPDFFHTYHGIGIGRHFACGEIDVWKSRHTANHGSWQAMFPCQPPPAGIMLRFPGQAAAGSIVLRPTEAMSGITFGMIIDALWTHGDEDFWTPGKKVRYLALAEAVATARDVKPVIV